MNRQATLGLVMACAIAALGVGGVTSVLSRSSPVTTDTFPAPATTDKEARICDPAECRSDQDKHPANCVCRYSALVVNLYGGAVELTNVANGVDFDLGAQGVSKQRVSWTIANSPGAFLFLDRNGNGVVDNGLELFGNLTPQLSSATDPERNGFLGLARYDRGELGGNGDGVIDNKDAVFASLRLWRDSNHNGISEAGELRNLREAGVEKISLAYQKAESHDRWGNLIRDQADIVGANHNAPGTVYDAALLLGDVSYPARAVGDPRPMGVFLGSTAFFPATVSTSNTSGKGATVELRFSIATSAHVPANVVRANFSIAKVSNKAGINYYPPPTTGSVLLKGGGVSNTVALTFSINDTNKGSGKLEYMISLDSIEVPTDLKVIMISPIELRTTLEVRGGQ